jgi:hypothetical protein
MPMLESFSGQRITVTIMLPNDMAGGRISVARWAGGRWLEPVPWRDCPEVKKGSGQTNLIKVITRGNQATVNINGKDVVTFKGQPPEGGGLIGFYTSGDGKQKAASEFSDLKVAK